MMKRAVRSSVLLNKWITSSSSNHLSRRTIRFNKGSSSFHHGATSGQRRQFLLTAAGVTTASVMMYYYFHNDDNDEKQQQHQGSNSIMMTPLYAEESGTNSESGKVQQQQGKKKLVILGSGWGAVSVLQGIDLDQYDVYIVSPRNYFLFTPMLPSTTTGSVDNRSIVDPIRCFIDRKKRKYRHPVVQYYQAKAVDLDCNNSIVVCKREKTENGERQTGDEYEFNVNYDELVIAVGSYVNTFNTPGVEKYCHFLKEIEHAQAIRKQIWSNLERASVPGLSEETKKQLLSITIVGGGPTGVETCGDINELVRREVTRYFPEIAHYVKLTIIQSQDHILNTFDAKMTDYAEKKFLRDNVNIVTNARVTEVRESELVVYDKGSKRTVLVPYGICLWSTGIKQNPLVEVLSSKLQQTSNIALNCDPYLRVKGVAKNNVFAIGDCSKIDSPKLLGKMLDLFNEADANKDGKLTLKELTDMVNKRSDEYPQFRIYANKIEELYEQFDTNKDNVLDKEEFEMFLKRADSELKSLPATAQVASQQGTYVAKVLNTKATGDNRPMPFTFNYLGSFANLGGGQAVAEIGSTYRGGGFSAYVLYKAAYLQKQVSLRNKYSLMQDWMKTAVFGRDMSKF